MAPSIRFIRSVSFSRSVSSAACSYNRSHRGFRPPELGINPFWDSGRVENERGPGDQNLVRGHGPRQGGVFIAGYLFPGRRYISTNGRSIFVGTFTFNVSNPKFLQSDRNRSTIVEPGLP